MPPFGDYARYETFRRAIHRVSTFESYCGLSRADQPHADDIVGGGLVVCALSLQFTRSSCPWFGPSKCPVAECVLPPNQQLEHAMSQEVAPIKRPEKLTAINHF